MALLWKTITELPPYGLSIPAVDVAMMMLLVKVARTMERPKDDSFVDIFGYAALAGEMSSMDF